MKVLIIGSGGREHALAWKLARDDPGIEILSAPGNPGLAELSRRIPIAAGEVGALAALAEAERVDLTVIGPEAPLAAGIVDAFRARRLPVFGPTRDAAEIETSKRFAKALMVESGVPTAEASSHTQADSAKLAVRELGAPVVVKASGLAAGKGVIICDSIAGADAAIDHMLLHHAFGAAGAEVLVEEFMEGEELSVFAITDGVRVLPMLPAQDHKRLGEGDVGPNTGGMGSYAPVSIGTADLVDRVVREIFEPTLGALRDAGRPFTGLLYAGLMLTDSGPKVVEFNCRFGDPETEALLPLMHSSLLAPMVAVASGEGLSGAGRLEWSDRHSVTTVVAAPGYPQKARVGEPIVLPDQSEHSILFHAGTERGPAGRLLSSGGRVLAVTGLGSTMEEAQLASRITAEAVELDGKQLRRDIGWREIERSARAT